MAHCWYHIFTKYFPITCTQAQTALRSHYSQIHYSWIGRRQCYLHKHTQLHMRAFKIVLHFPSPLVDLEERKVVELFKRRRGMKSRFIVGFNDDGEQTKRWRLKVTKPRWKEWEVPPSRLLLQLQVNLLNLLVNLTVPILVHVNVQQKWVKVTKKAEKCERSINQGWLFPSCMAAFPEPIKCQYRYSINLSRRIYRRRWLEPKSHETSSKAWQLHDWGHFKLTKPSQLPTPPGSRIFPLFQNPRHHWCSEGCSNWSIDFTLEYCDGHE